MPIALTLLMKPGCHLCDTAREVVAGVVAELEGIPTAARVTVSELSSLADPELVERYAEEIPVLLIDGRVHTIWRIDPARLRAALLED